MAYSSSPSSLSKPSAVSIALTNSRKELWSAQLPSLLNPIRVFFIDPSIQFWSVVLPPAATYMQIDRSLALLVRITCLAPLRLVAEVFPPDMTTDTSRSMAKNELLRAHPPLPFQPPSDFASAIHGAFAFTMSVAADLIGAFLNPEKMRKWWEAIGAFRAYLVASGVGAELEESMMKPLWRGRLLDNLKILNDIQEMQDTDRTIRATGRGEGISSKTTSDTDLRQELLEGCRMMRFATAAYGCAMVRSAVDREARHQDIEDDMKSIAFHTDISFEDIKYLHAIDGGDMNVLRHFVAVDHNSKSVVLAIRGTLSLSGALVDMQAMDCEYCGGRAHKGIAEQADHIWDESGYRIQEVLADFPDYSFVLVGHSLGAGAACLLHIKIYCESLMSGRTVRCYGFAPPPTYCAAREPSKAIQDAIQNCVCYVHDNDCVPLLSISSIRRLADLMDAVDNQTEHIWFWRRFRIFWEFDAVPQMIIEAVTNISRDEKKRTIGESEMIIPARVVVWMKKNFAGQFEALACPPSAIAKLDVFICEDMASDHLPEQYEDALDMLTVRLQQTD